MNTDWQEIVQGFRDDLKRAEGELDDAWTAVIVAVRVVKERREVLVNAIKRAEASHA